MKKSYCSKCCGDTNHKVLFEKEDVTDDFYADVSFSYTYYTLECAGCEAVSFRRDYDDTANSHWSYEDEDYTIETKTSIFPGVIRNHRALENDIYLPKKIRNLYKESLGCIQADCKVLAAASFRAIIEAVCADKSIRGRDLKAKISNLKSGGLISNEDARRLHSIRFMGNDALHEVESPSEEKILLVLQVVEHLLNSVYLFNHLGADILETPIETIDEFKKLILQCIRQNKFIGEKPLKEILGKSFRRVEDAFVVLETQLQNEIKSGTFSKLKSVGSKSHPKLGNAEHYELIVPPIKT